MTPYLADALWARLAFLAGEADLLRRAWEFYLLTFEGHESPPVSPAQIATVGECLQTARSWQDAQERVDKFISRQLRKLEGKQTSWRTPVPLPDGSTFTLGEVLRDWVCGEKYLSQEPVSIHLDRLAALRRFWSYIEGQYSYRQTFEKPMSLKEMAE